MRDEAEEPTGAWTTALADRDGLRCEFCSGPVARFQPIVITRTKRVMHKGCFEDQPTRIIAKIKRV